MDNQSAGNYPGEKVRQSWFIRLVILISVPSILYSGYCIGLWGRNSLLLQHLFQCKCLSFSEEWRYPKEVDVLVSACSKSAALLSPSGNLLFVRENNKGNNSTYLLDLQTYEKVKFYIPEGSIYFLTDELVFLSLGYGDGEIILDIKTKQQYPIQEFIFLQPNAYSYGKLDANLLFRALSQVEQVFLIDTHYQPTIALSSDFRTYPVRSFTFQARSLSSDSKNLLEQFLQQNHIKYYHVAAIYPHEVASPDERFIARDDGIYLVETDQRIVNSPTSFVMGWTNNGNGAIYSSGGRCLIRRGLPFADDVGCAVRVPQPVLLLKVPEEYLSSSETP